MRFDAFGFAMIECFMILAGEGWSSRMYAVMERRDHGAPAFYYIAEFIFGQYALLNLTLAIVLDGSSALLPPTTRTRTSAARMVNGCCAEAHRTSRSTAEERARARGAEWRRRRARRARGRQQRQARLEWAAARRTLTSHSDTRRPPRQLEARGQPATTISARETDESRAGRRPQAQADAAAQRNLGMDANRARRPRRKKTARLASAR